MPTPLVMVILDALGLVACLVVLALYRGELPAEASTLLTTIASLFGLCLRDAHQYEFGSSRGSREKTALLGGPLAGLSAGANSFAQPPAEGRMNSPLPGGKP